MSRWACTIRGFPVVFYDALTRDKARYKAWQAARAAGYEITFAEITVTAAEPPEKGLSRTEASSHTAQCSETKKETP